MPQGTEELCLAWLAVNLTRTPTHPRAHGLPAAPGDAAVSIVCRPSLRLIIRDVVRPDEPRPPLPHDAVAGGRAAGAAAFACRSQSSVRAASPTGLTTSLRPISAGLAAPPCLDLGNSEPTPVVPLVLWEIGSLFGSSLRRVGSSIF